MLKSLLLVNCRPSKGYPILFVKDDLTQLIADFSVRFADKKKVVIIADENVSKLYGEEFVEKLREVIGESIQADLFVVPAGEATKNLQHVEELAEQMLGLGHDRSSLIVAFGGGVVGDLAGFLASIYMRGVDFVQIPTSLLAMVDASIGGKTGVDLKSGKNLLGSFWQPQAVYLMPSFLRTLSNEQFNEGMAELLKHALIGDLGLWHKLETELKATDLRDSAVLNSILQAAIAVKVKLVEEDECEQGRRAWLNLGHTVAHGLEQVSNYKISHGQAVALGILIETEIAVNKQLVSPTLVERIKKVWAHYALPSSMQNFALKIELESLWEALKTDKKNKDDQIICSLLKELGSEVVVSSINKEELNLALKKYE